MKNRRVKISSIAIALLLTTLMMLPLFGCNTFERDGEFITIQKAYDQEFLSEEDLKDLNQWINNDSYNVRLDQTAVNAIQEAAAYEMRTRKEDPIPSAKVNEIIVSKYTIMNGCIPVRVRHIDSEYPNTEWKFEVAGVKFEYTGPEVRIWKESGRASGPIYTMREAYARGYISVDDVKEIADMHNAVDKFCEPFEDDITLTLSERVKNKIREQYAVDYNKNKYALYPDLETKNVFILKDYGSYNGYRVIIAQDNMNGFADETYTIVEKVAGIDIKYNALTYFCRIMFYKL